MFYIKIREGYYTMKNYNTHNKDLLTSLGIGEYLKAIMQIPLSNSTTKYNVTHKSETCTAVQKFSRYRSLCYKERAAKLRIAELTADLLRAEKSAEPVPYIQRKRIKLRELTLELSRIILKRRDLEALRDSISNEFTAQVVQHRYFSYLDRRLPTWQQTAQELGIGISGEELRRHICSELRKM